MASVTDLRTYYINNLKAKVFFSRESISHKQYSIMYLHDLSEEEKHFVDTFTQYFPYYIWNEDMLDGIDISSAPEANLLACSQNAWKGTLNPLRENSRNGIFGEVFLDFYERVVNDRRVLTTYGSRREYLSKKENKGYDHIGYIFENNQLEIVLGEAKYVTDVNSARTDLSEDINGKAGIKKGHLTKEYLNGFMHFVIENRCAFSDAEKEEIKELIRPINHHLAKGDMTVLEYIISENIKVNVVLFAIFQDSRRTVISFEKQYDRLNAEAITALTAMGITNYSIEVVFIPTEATSMKIKEAIGGFYGAT